MTTTSAHKRLGLIGLGSFGKLAAHHLREHFEVIATDSVDRSAAAAELGIEWGSDAEAAHTPGKESSSADPDVARNSAAKRQPKAG